MIDPYTLPDDLPPPVDDGAADHLSGLALPDVQLPATDGRRVYAGLNSGGIAAYDVATGTRAWTTPLTPAADRRGGHSGAVSAIPNVVLSAGWDGVVRALSAEDGRVLWFHDTITDVATVNRVPARGEIVRHPAGIEFEVLEADPRRIKKLRILRQDQPTTGAEAGA